MSSMRSFASLNLSALSSGCARTKGTHTVLNPCQGLVDDLCKSKIDSAIRIAVRVGRFFFLETAIEERGSRPHKNEDDEGVSLFFFLGRRAEVEVAGAE